MRPQASPKVIADKQFAIESGRPEILEIVEKMVEIENNRKKLLYRSCKS